MSFPQPHLHLGTHVLQFKELTQVFSLYGLNNTLLKKKSSTIPNKDQLQVILIRDVIDCLRTECKPFQGFKCPLGYVISFPSSFLNSSTSGLASTSIIINMWKNKIQACTTFDDLHRMTEMFSVPDFLLCGIQPDSFFSTVFSLFVSIVTQVGGSDSLACFLEDKSWIRIASIVSLDNKQSNFFVLASRYIQISRLFLLSFFYDQSI